MRETYESVPGTIEPALDSVPNGPLLSPSSPAAALEALAAGGLEVDQRVGAHLVGDHLVVARSMQPVQAVALEAGLQEVATAHHAACSVR